MSSFEFTQPSDQPEQSSPAEALFWRIRKLSNPNADPRIKDKEICRTAVTTIFDPEEAEQFLIGYSEFIDKYYPIDNSSPEDQLNPRTSMDFAISNLKLSTAEIIQTDKPLSNLEETYGALPEAFQIAVNKIENNSFASLAR